MDILKQFTPLEVSDGPLFLFFSFMNALRLNIIQRITPKPKTKVSYKITKEHIDYIRAGAESYQKE